MRRRSPSTAIPIEALRNSPSIRRLERVAQALAERRRLALGVELGEHRELVAAEAGERLVDVEHRLQARRDLASSRRVALPRGRRRR